ncbi:MULTISPECIES: DUF6074 family protein [unclassified Bradyrhizobium]|uniref:DUF6074 family protein n=1 Tax=unclassified Bradyrhizobium TaxID=2631580 RepID=UPI002916C90A|nr:MULTISPECIES: DUF6074 family protein [unclassified Bradyrhizobium]
MSGKVAQAVRDARRAVAPPGTTGERLHISIASPRAKVLLLPGRFRDAAYICRHVEFVLTRPAEQGEQHIQRNLNAVRRTLEEMGVDQDAIKAEVQRIEAAVRAELWRQVLLPGGDE